jgi:hypothetical protein
MVFNGDNPIMNEDYLVPGVSSRLVQIPDVSMALEDCSYHIIEG